LIQGGRGNLPNTRFWPKSPPPQKKITMAKCTPKWQHLAWFREGGEIYQILTFGVFWKKATQKAPKRFEMAKCTPNKWQHLEGGEIYQILTFGIFWKKASQKPIFFSKRLRNSILATPGLIREGRGGSTKYPLMAYFEKKPPKNGAKMAKTDWQREFVYRTSDMLVLLPKTSRSCCS